MMMHDSDEEEEQTALVCDNGLFNLQKYFELKFKTKFNYKTDFIYLFFSKESRNDPFACFQRFLSIWVSREELLLTAQNEANN